MFSYCTLYDVNKMCTWWVIIKIRNNNINKVSKTYPLKALSRLHLLNRNTKKYNNINKSGRRVRCWFYYFFIADLKSCNVPLETFL